MSKPQNLRYPIVPIQVLCVYLEQIPAGKRPARGVKDVQRLVYKLAQLAKAFVHRPNVRWLFARLVQRSAWTTRQITFWHNIQE